MRTYPHQIRKETCRAIMLVLIISVIAMALFSCSKSGPIDQEKGHGPLNFKDSTYKLVGWPNKNDKN